MFDSRMIDQVLYLEVAIAIDVYIDIDISGV